MGLFSTFLQKSQKSPSGLLIANPANPANWDDQKDAGLAGIEAGLAAPRMKIEDSCSANPASNPANQDDQNEAGLAGLAGLAISSPKDEDCDFLLPAWAPAPHPRIALESPFGLDRPPLQLRAAWIAVCAESPAGIDPVCFEAAMFNVAQLFGDWGRLIEIYRWTPADLFGRPDGLAWAIKSHHYPVTAIGPRMAMMRDERVWRRGRKES